MNIDQDDFQLRHIDVTQIRYTANKLYGPGQRKTIKIGCSRQLQQIQLLPLHPFSLKLLKPNFDADRLFIVNFFFF